MKSVRDGISNRFQCLTPFLQVTVRTKIQQSEIRKLPKINCGHFLDLLSSVRKSGSKEPRPSGRGFLKPGPKDNSTGQTDPTDPDGFPPRYGTGCTVE